MMWSRLKVVLIVSVIKTYLGDITVSREASGDKFIVPYECNFYNAVATSNQNECLCRNNEDNGTLIQLQNGTIICYYEVQSFSGKILLSRTLTLREKCPNTEFFLVRIFLYLD